MKSKSLSNLKPLVPQFSKATHFTLFLFILSTTMTYRHIALYNTQMKTNYTIKFSFFYLTVNLVIFSYHLTNIQICLISFHSCMVSLGMNNTQFI